MDCRFQTAGSDQFGNIVSGIDLIRREYGHEAAQSYGITSPLVMGSDGKKIGKTESGAIWLSPQRTSPYAFYQYWINTDDADVESFLKWFTFIEQAEIESTMAAHAASPHERGAQRALARAMTSLVHGDDALAGVEAASQALFSGQVRELDEAALAEVFADVPHTTHDRTALEGDGCSLIELLPQTSLASSKREAREFLTNGAINVNGDKAALDQALTTSDLLHGATILIKRGKRKWHATKWS